MLKGILESASKSKKKGLVTLDIRESFMPGPKRSDIRAAASLSPPVRLINSPQPSTSKSPASAIVASSSQPHNESSSSYNASKRPSPIPVTSQANPDTIAVHRRRESSTTSNSDPLYAKIDSSYKRKADDQVQVEVEVHNDESPQLSQEGNRLNQLLIPESSEPDEYNGDQQQLIESIMEEEDDNTFVEHPVPPPKNNPFVEHPVSPPNNNPFVVPPVPPPKNNPSLQGEDNDITRVKSPVVPPLGILKVSSTEPAPGPSMTTPVKTNQKPLYSSSVTTSGGSSKAEFVFSPQLPPLIYKRLGIDDEKQTAHIWLQAALVFLAFCVFAALLAMFLIFAVMYSDLADESGEHKMQIPEYKFELKLNLPHLKFTNSMNVPQSETYVATRYQLLNYIDKTLQDENSYLLNDFYGYTDVNSFSNATVGVDASLTVVLEDIEDDKTEEVKTMKSVIIKTTEDSSQLWTFVLPDE